MPKNRNRNRPAELAVPPVETAPVLSAAEQRITTLKAELKALRTTGRAVDVQPIVEPHVTAMVAAVLEKYPGRVIRALTIQIKDNKFLKFGQVRIVKPRTGDESESAESESEAA